MARSQLPRPAAENRDRSSRVMPREICYVTSFDIDYRPFEEQRSYLQRRRGNTFVPQLLGESLQSIERRLGHRQ